MQIKPFASKLMIPVLCLAAFTIPFKHNIGQIFLFVSALLAIYLSDNNEDNNEDNNKDNDEVHKSGLELNSKSDMKRLKKTGNILIGLVIGLIICGTVSTYNATGNFKPGLAFRIWKYSLTAALFIRFFIVKEVERKIVFSSLIVSSTVTAFIVFFFSETFWIRRHAYVFDRAISGGGANVFPAIWAILFIIFVSLLTLPYKKEELLCFFTKNEKVVYILLSILALFIVGAGKSRAALGLVMAGLFLLIVISKVSLKYFGSAILGLVLLITIVPRFQRNPISENSSYFYRYETCRIAVSMMKENPLFGVGPKNFRKNFQRIYQKKLMGFNPRCANNFYFSVLAEQGIAGLLLFLTFVIVLSKELWKRAKADRYSMALFIAFGAYLASGMVVDNKFLAQQSGMVMVLLIALTYPQVLQSD